ncbi:MAG: ecotin [Acidiferrobacterales bacterium]|nr:ecotin [Acidiferrobacterales bacterium]
MVNKHVSFLFAAWAPMMLLISCANATGAKHNPLDAFPEAKEGMRRFVISLPGKQGSEEESLKVELIVGKEMLTDGVNRVRLANTIEAHTLKGWGYSYYEVTGSSEVMSTLMAPPEGAPKVQQFVAGAPVLVRYNSRLPIVVYVPAGLELRYRIWRAADTFNKAVEK